MRFKFTRFEALDPQKLYKTTQLIVNGKEEMYFVEDGYGRYHADILAEILKLNNLPLTIKEERTTNGGYVLRGDGFIVAGMGGARLLRTNCVILFGNSVKFTMGISETHAEKYFLGKKGWRYWAAPLPDRKTA